MKLLIDIPYEAYYTFKCDLGKGNLNALAEIVANGTPYNPSGDLISREALKEAIHNSNPSVNREWLIMELDKIIDNAPTVEPERPQGDLISREALKQAVSKVVAEERKEDEKWATGLRYSLKLIDNAQAISLPDEQIAWEQGYEVGLAQGKQDRPQGDWIIVKDEKYGDNVKCPFCGKELAGTDLNFCCKCGADMRGGAE